MQSSGTNKQLNMRWVRPDTRPEGCNQTMRIDRSCQASDVINMAEVCDYTNTRGRKTTYWVIFSDDPNQEIREFTTEELTAELTRKVTA